jgi:hypothetical protein
VKAARPPSALFTHYWQIWAALTLVSFLVPETFALFTNWQNTLSANVWRFEGFDPRQSVLQWSAGHFLFIGVLFLLDVWLLGHFGWGKWR